jgi:16S rRNA (guanine966-N2)-methyltransferase
MRLISGSAGGIPLEVPKSVTRPTQDRVRQAVFNMLGELVQDARVLDLFAGSGALGLECLSRSGPRGLRSHQTKPRQNATGRRLHPTGRRLQDRGSTCRER